jgi:hypothetical protein
MEQPEFDVGDLIMCRNSWDEPWKKRKVVDIHPDFGPVTDGPFGRAVWIEVSKSTPEGLEAYESCRLARDRYQRCMERGYRGTVDAAYDEAQSSYYTALEKAGISFHDAERYFTTVGIK